MGEGISYKKVYVSDLVQDLSGKLDVMRCYNVGCVKMFISGKLDILVLDVINLQCCLFMFWNAFAYGLNSKNGLDFKNESNFKNGYNSKNGLNFENGPNF
jgi:hypothetical protein